MTDATEENDLVDDVPVLPEVPAPGIARAVRPRRLRIGPVAVSVPALAWSLSVALHAAAAGAALLVMRSWLPPAIYLSRGDPAGVQWGWEAQGSAAPEAIAPPPGAAIPDSPQVTEAPASPTQPLLDLPDLPSALSATDVTPSTFVRLDQGTTAHVAEAFPESAERGAAPRMPTRMPRGDIGTGDGAASAAGSAGTGAGTAGGAGSGEGGGVARSGIAGGLDRHSIPQPIYPRESQRRGEQGQVVLEMEVRADGSVGEVRIIKDGGFPRLAQAAIDAVRSAYIEPAREDGRAVASRVSIPFNFVLKSAKAR